MQLQCRTLSLVAPYRAIPQDYLSDTPVLRAMGVLVSQHGNWVRYPLPLFWAFPPLGEHAKWRCDTPPPPTKGVSRRYLSDTLWQQGERVRYRYPPSAILSRKGISEGRGCLEEGCLGHPGASQTFFWPAIFCPRKWRKNGKNLSSQTSPGSPTRPSCRHPRLSKYCAIGGGGGVSHTGPPRTLS